MQLLNINEITENTINDIIINKDIDKEVCPLCSATLGEHNKTISLKDMNTYICLKCHRKEFSKELYFEKRIKIKIFGEHFGWINERLLYLFDKTGIKNRTAWIVKAAKEDFGINLTDRESVEELDIAVRFQCYIDKNDWLRERMRQEIKKSDIII